MTPDPESPAPSADLDGEAPMTPARFLAELMEGFTGAGGPVLADAPRPEPLAWVPRDLAAAGRLVSGFRRRAERAVQRLLAETGPAGDGSEHPVIIDGAFLRDHGAALLGAVIGGDAGESAEASRPPYRAYRLDLVSIAAEGLAWASEAGEGLLKAAGVNDPAGALGGLARGLDGLPWKMRDLVGAAGGLVAGLLDAVPAVDGSTDGWSAAETGLRGALEAAGLGVWPDEEDDLAAAVHGVTDDDEAESAETVAAEEQGDERN